MFDSSGSLMIEMVIFLLLASILSAASVSQLTLAVRISRDEDVKVQGIMATRIKMEDLRSRRSLTPTPPDKLEEWDPYGFDLLGTGLLKIEEVEPPDLYQVTVFARDKKGATVWFTQSLVYVP